MDPSATNLFEVDVCSERGLSLSKPNIQPFDKLRARSAGLRSLNGDVAMNPA